MDRKSIANQVLSLLVSAAILAAGVLVFFALIHKPEPEASASPQAEPTVVRTLPVLEHEGRLDIVVDGIVTPYREIEVAAEVAGKVVYKNEACNAGRFVTKGTPLIRIDASDYKLQARRLTSQSEQADASLRELAVEVTNTEELIKLAKDQLEFERDEVSRLAGLIQERIVTDSAMDQAKQAELAARDALVRLQNELRLLKPRKTKLQSAKELVAADLELAALNISRTEVAAAVDGVVVRDLVEQGSYVQKGTPLLTLEDTSAVEVKCRLRMEELHWLWRGANSRRNDNAAAADYQIPQTPVSVTYELAGQDTVRYEWQGVLSRYDGIGLDEVTRTVPCRVVVSAPRDVKVVGAGENGRSLGAPPALVRGMFVSVQLHIDQPSPLFLVPEPAVQPGKAVWVVRNGLLVLVKPLTLIELIEHKADGGDSASSWLVESNTSALKVGDRVVVPPFGVLTAGMAVREDETP